MARHSLARRSPARRVFARRGGATGWVLAAALLALGACSPAGGDKAFGARVHAYLLAHPEVLAEMQAEASKSNASADNTVTAPAAAPDPGPLIQAHAAEIFHDSRDPSIGPKDAKVVVALFEDYQCGHCKAEAAPALARLIPEHPKVRFVFKEYPIFGTLSQSAARSAIAASRQGRYWPVFQSLMASPLANDAQIDGILRADHVDLAQARAVASRPEVQAQLNAVSQLAHVLGVEGTPTFVLGDQMIAGTNVEQIEQLLAQKSV